MVILMTTFLMPVCKAWFPGLDKPSTPPATPSLVPETGVSNLRLLGYGLRDVCCSKPNATIGRQVVPADRVGVRSPHVLLVPRTLHRSCRRLSGRLRLDHTLTYVLRVLKLGED